MDSDPSFVRVLSEPGRQRLIEAGRRSRGDLLSLWTEEKIARLRQLTVEGVGATAVGIELGFTRNAIIGKRFRLGITTGKRAVRGPHNEKNRRKKGLSAIPRKPKEQTVEIWPQLTQLADLVPARVSMLDISDNQCRFPLDETVDNIAIWCGLEVQEDSPYCPYHHRHTHYRAAPR